MYLVGPAITLVPISTQSGEFDGIIILKVTPGGPAEKVLLKPADQLITVNNMEIKGKSYDEVRLWETT